MECCGFNQSRDVLFFFFRKIHLVKSRGAADETIRGIVAHVMYVCKHDLLIVYIH